MNHQERIKQANEELQVLSFNMLDELESLNVHSGQEAARDLNDRIFGMVDEMRKHIRDLLHNLRQINRTAEMDEVKEMDALLEVTRHCSVEPGSYRNFVSTLIPLIKLLTSWSENGPVQYDSADAVE
ncbi:MAG: hypothetical protein WCX65_19650 [bacterium]